MASIHYTDAHESTANDVIVGGPTWNAIRQAIASGRAFTVTAHLNGRRVVAAKGNAGTLDYVRNDLP